jgi:hypothetical protein
VLGFVLVIRGARREWHAGDVMPKTRAAYHGTAAYPLMRARPERRESVIARRRMLTTRITTSSR